MIRQSRGAGLLLLIVLPMASQAWAQPSPGPDQPVLIEYYYKAVWGHQQEFIDLFRKNHLPLLLKEKEKGRLLDIVIMAPRYHATEDGRWDYRVTLTFKNAAAALGEGAITETEIRKLFPDKAAYDKEEQRRFEILEAHWDVPVVMTPLRP
jgi:hypothetical protein